MKIFITMVSLMMILTACSKSPSSGSQMIANPTPNVEEVDGTGSHGLIIANGGSIESTGSVLYSTPSTTIADFGVLKYGVNENHTLALTLKNKSTTIPYNVVLSIPSAFKDVISSVATSTGTPAITFTADPQNPSVLKSNVITLAKALTATSPKSLVLNVIFNVAKTGAPAQAIGTYSQLVGLEVDKSTEIDDVAQVLNYNVNYSIGGASILTDLKAGFTVAGSDASIDVGSYVAVDDTASLGLVVQPTIQNFSKNVNGYKIRKVQSDAFSNTVVADDFTITNDVKCLTLAYPSNCKITVKYANTSATPGLKSSFFYINDQLVSLKVNVVAPTPKVSFTNATIGSTSYAVASNSVTVGPFTNGEGIKNIKLNFKNEYLSTDANKKIFSDLALSGVSTPFALAGSNCLPLNPSASCYNTITFDTTGKANNTYSMPFSFQSTTYPYELIQGALNVVMNTVVVQACTLADASNPLSGISSANGVKGVTGAFGSCSVQLCSSVYNKASDSKSCLLKTSLACAYDTAFGADRGLDSSTGVSSVKGNLGSCLVNSCLGGYDKSIDEKICSPSSVVSCTMANALNNGLSTLSNVASVSGNVPSCLVATCVPGFDKSGDSKSCTPSVVACTSVNALNNGVTSMSNVLTVSGNVPSCLAATCSPGYSLASDSKSCVQDVVACTNANAVGNGLTSLSNVLTVSGNVPSCLVATCSPGFDKSGDSKSCIASVVACTNANASANGVIMANVLTVSGNVPSCLAATCSPGYSLASDSKSCIQDVVACTKANAVGNGLTSIRGVLTVKGNLPSCLVDTCRSSPPNAVPWSKAADEKTCIAPAYLNLWKARAVGSIKGDVPDSLLLNSSGYTLTVSLNDVPLVPNGDNDTPIDINFSDFSFPVLPANTVLTDPAIVSGADSDFFNYITYASYITNPSNTFKVVSTLNSGIEHVEWVVGTTGNYTLETIGSQKVWHDSSVTILSVSPDGKNLEYKLNAYSEFSEVYERIQKKTVINQNLTTIRGTNPSDLKCAVSITGTPLVNDQTMIVDGGPTQTVNSLDSTTSATITLGSCAPGYTATIKEIASASDVNATAMSATYCVGNTCIVPMDQARFVKIDTVATLYPFNGIAILRENGTDVEVPSLAVNMDRSIVNKAIGESVTNSISANSIPMFSSANCTAYAGKIGAINLAVDPRCSAGLTQYTNGAIATRNPIANTDIYVFQGYELPTGLSLTGANFSALVGAGASTVSNTYKAIIIPTNSISSDLEYFAKNVSYNILPLNNDSIEFYGKVYDMNLSNYISDVKFQVLDSVGTDITSRFNVQCFNQTSGAQIGSTVLASTFNASACLNNRDILSMARLVFRYDSLDYQGETDPSIRSIIEDEYRTGSYTVNLNAVSKNILSDAQMSTKTIPVSIKINPDNDIVPPFTIADDASLSNVIVDHGGLPSTGKPRDFNAWGGGIDYEIGSSNKKFLTGTTTLLASETGAYKNMNYNYSLPVTSEKLGRIIFNKSLMPASALAKAYNIRVRVFDSQTTSCLYVNDSSLSSYMDGDHLGQLSANPKTALADVASSLYFKYQFNAQVSTVSKTLVRPNGTSTNDNSNGCGSIASVAPEVTEKYDFIGNDDFACQAGEVCYVNDLSKTLSNGVSVNSTNRVALKAYRVRVRMISEDMERTDKVQIVRVEKADSGIIPVANATFDVIPYVDNRMNPTNDGLNYNLAFDAASLDFVDYKTPGNSSVKVSISAPSLCSSGSPCSYKFIRYGTDALDQGLKSTGSQVTSAQGYPIWGHYASNDDLSSSPTFGASASSIMNFSGIGGPASFINGVYTSNPLTGSDLANHNMEVLAIVKKDNVTYKKLINIAATHRIHEQPVMYAVKSIYTSGSLSGMKMIYDLNRYDEQGNVKPYDPANPSVGTFNVSSDTYPHTVRQGFYPENLVQFRTNEGTTLINTINYSPVSALVPGLPTATNYNSNESASGYIFPIQGSNLNFWKLAQVWYADGVFNQATGAHDDNFFTYVNFKQCAEATPYFYYGASGWACYADSSALADGWK